MDPAPRWSRLLRRLAFGAVMVAVAASLWALAMLGGMIGVPVAVLGFVGAVIALIALAATWSVGRAGRAVREIVELHRYGRWLSFREWAGPAPPSKTDIVVHVVYHDAVGGAVAGVPISYHVRGDVISVAESIAVTDDDGVAVIPVHVSSSPTVVRLHAAVQGDPSVRGVDGEFLIGLG